jgi:tetratricopeptide (TPR) repeat protein
MKSGRQAGNRGGAAIALLRLFAAAMMSALIYALWVDVAPRLQGSSRTQTRIQGSHWGIVDVRWVGDAVLTPADVPKTRLIAPGHAPDEALASIQDELLKGNLSEAARRLRSFAGARRSRSEEERFLVAMWNNLGVHQHKMKGPEIAAEAFRRALALNPASPVANLNLAHVYWELRSPALTQEFLERVIQMNAGEPLPRILMAELMIKQGDLAAAARYLNSGAARTGSDPALRAHAEKLLAKVRRPTPSVASLRLPAEFGGRVEESGSAVESEKRDERRPTIPDPGVPQPVPRPTSPGGMIESPGESTSELGAGHFVVKYVGKKDQEAWERIRAILEYAYHDVGKTFGEYPTTTISVVLHPDEEFLDLAGTPTWADMLFDADSGEIHLPLQGALTDLAGLSRVLRHEFVHALLRHRIGPRSEAIPTWLVEGLAIQLAEDSWPDVEAVTTATLTLIPLATLEGPWTQLPKKSLPQAYLEAQVAAKTVVDQHTLPRIWKLLAFGTTGKHPQTVMPELRSLTDDRFQAQWKARFGVKPAAAGS